MACHRVHGYAPSRMSEGEFHWSIADEPAPAPAAAGGRTDSLFTPTRIVGEQFQLLDALGSGGMGRVLRARDLRSGREVALKFLLGVPSPLALQRFDREGELTAALDHPGIVRIHGRGVHEGRPFLVYELIEPCRSFDSLLEAARPEPRRTVPLLLEVARALAHAHAQGVVHRDLKPQNILLDGQGRARVTDFGVAAAEGQERLTRTGAIVGTPPYMAPEQWSRAAGDMGPPADVWALGVLLYQCLSGAHPFPAGTLLEQEARVLNATPRPLSAVAPPVSPALEAVCTRALLKDPARRYPHAEAFAEALERAWDGGRGLAPPPRATTGRLLTGAALLTGASAGLAAVLVLGAASQTERGAVAPTSSAAPGTPLVRESAAPPGGPLIAALSAGEPLTAIAARLGEDGQETELGRALRALGAAPLSTDTPAWSALEAASAPLRDAAARWLLGELERDLAFLERGALPGAGGGLSLEARWDRAAARLQAVARLAAGLEPELERQLDRIRARLLPPGAPERVAGLERLLAALPADPWGCLLRAEDLVGSDPGAALEALARAATPAASSQAWRRRLVLARVRALLALHCAAQALSALEACDDPPDPELAEVRVAALERLERAPEAAAARQHLSRLRGAERAEAHELVLAALETMRVRDDLDHTQRDLARALELDPASPFAAFYLAQARYAQGDRLEGVRDCAPPVVRSPWLQSELQSALMVLLYARRAVNADRAPLLELWDDSLPGRVGRLFVLAALVEFERRADLAGEALALADALLREEPALVAAWLLRGFLHLRAGRLEHAARDLQVAREAYPYCPVLLFYEGLLLAARREPREEVIAAFVRAHEGGYQLWARKREMSGWTPFDYPELERIPELIERVRSRSPRLRLRIPPGDWQ